MADLFISYSKTDIDFASALAQQLKAQGFDVWWDANLYAGDSFHDIIRTEINNAKAVVVIWSEHAAASQWVRGEAQEAFDQKKLLATHIPNFDARRAPINFRGIHTELVLNIDRLVSAILARGVTPVAAAGKANREARMLHIRADYGEPTAAMILGCVYDKGDAVLGIERDSDAAIRYLRLGAKGHPMAQLLLGLKYEFGDGVEKDQGEAVRLYSLSASQGNPLGQMALGNMLRDGRGIDQNEAEAVRLFRLASDQGDPKGHVLLGSMYEEGRGVPRDLEAAVRLYQLSAGQGYDEGYIYLGLMYEHGNGVRQDYSEAVRLYRLAADKGSATGQMSLGLMYEFGWGVKRDTEEARRLYELAAEQGLEPAMECLERLTPWWHTFTNLWRRAKA